MPATLASFHRCLPTSAEDALTRYAEEHEDETAVTECDRLREAEFSASIAQLRRAPDDLSAWIKESMTAQNRMLAEIYRNQGR